MWTRIQLPMVLLSLFGGLPFGLAAFFWVGPIRLVFALHAQCFVNSICHMREDAGPDEGDRQERRLAVADALLRRARTGTRTTTTAPARPASAGPPPQLDIGWYLILLLETLGLATDVRRPSNDRALDAAA